ncbi:hypothetical protein P3S67_025694 [Capsicum chacoense]
MADLATPIIAEHSEEQVEGPSTRKTRGKTQMHKLPRHIGEECVTLCPLDIFIWRLMDTKKDLWDYTQAEMEEIEMQ